MERGDEVVDNYDCRNGTERKGWEIRYGYLILWLKEKWVWWRIIILEGAILGMVQIII